MKTKSHTTSRIYKFLCSLLFALTSLLLLLCSFFATAQDYEWDWAVSGGGMTGPEHIYDMKVGSDNNYYFIGTMYGTIGVHLDGEPVTTYNSSVGNNDIFIFSTTCDGTVRWSQAIGGQGSSDKAFNLVLDSDNNVYVGVYVQGGSTYSVFFSPIHSIGPLPADTEAYKRIFLVKYNSDGEYQGRKALQGTVDDSNNQAQLLDLFMDDNDILHFITGLSPGTHLDDNVTVPNTVTGYHYFLAKYDTNLNYISSMLLPITDFTGFSTNNNPVRFVYDKNLNRYYIGSTRTNGSNLTPLTYDSEPVINRSFIIAFNGTDGSQQWRREIYSEPNSSGFIQLTRLRSLAIDDNSDVYIGGILNWNPVLGSPVKIYDPYDSTTNYTFIPNAYTPNMPFLARLNNQGTVQWIKTPELDTNYSSNTSLIASGIALRANEVALGSSETYFKWDNLSLNRPDYYWPDPTLLRFDKQTGAAIAMHDIYGGPGNNQSMTAVAVDNDGNYVVGGNFSGGLFINSDSTVPPIYSVGQNDFFVARLAATACGTPVVSTKDFNMLKLSAYPNPTTAIVNIETDKMLLSYIVYDLSGRQVQSGMFSNNNQINLQNENNGVYFIKITTLLGKSTTLKVIKK